MVRMGLPVPDVMDGRSGVDPQSRHPDRILFLLDLRGGAQCQPYRKFSQAAPVFVAMGLLREEDVIAKTRFDFSEQGIRGPPAV